MFMKVLYYFVVTFQNFVYIYAVLLFLVNISYVLLTNACNVFKFQ